ncbi:Tripartite tricarboxylate transporter family receptor [Pigmentiphaga humi]|uniref:Tripartite tricarboxylate transporter family receptor n=1 Tax=Pigmentiphaga humi TaxID=2478468 RepID=A0A3P4B5L8_9BURK|nr:tripartite tricarboxylate transporter substrate binding protein [Pigmentiphaga humi]VCU70826.1 Tripartite tricarboxylate transporter family receptor [Pigmentiphaga humi]
MFSRRQFVACAVAATAGLHGSAALAAGWPEKPITLIVPFAPGGATDIVGRIVADQLGKRLGVTIVVDNRAGAAGAIGMSELARSQPDGYAFALITDSIPLQPLLRQSLDWRMDQFEPIAKIATSPELLVVNARFPARTVKEFVERAKAQPGKISYAASSTGSVHHLAGEIFRKQTGIDITHIPYKGGGQSIVDMVSGRVDAGFIGLAPVLNQLKSGQLRALAQTGDKRDPQAPDVPTFAEAGFKAFDVQLWIGLVGLGGTPAGVSAKMQDAVAQMLAAPEVQAKFKEIGFEAVSGSQKEFGPWLARQQQAWAELVQKLGLVGN